MGNNSAQRTRSSELERERDRGRGGGQNPNLSLPLQNPILPGPSWFWLKMSGVAAPHPRRTSLSQKRGSSTVSKKAVVAENGSSNAKASSPTQYGFCFTLFHVFLWVGEIFFTEPTGCLLECRVWFNICIALCAIYFPGIFCDFLWVGLDYLSLIGPFAVGFCGCWYGNVTLLKEIGCLWDFLCRGGHCDYLTFFSQYFLSGNDLPENKLGILKSLGYDNCGWWF